MLRHIRRIEIELHSYCNRRCLWCTNSKFPREKYSEMSEETYIKLLKEIRDNNFGITRFFDWQKTKQSGMELRRPTISFNGYSEPLSDIELLKKRVNQAKDILSGEILFVCNTNGDFLTKENLENLFLNRIYIMDYDCKGKEYWMDKFKELNVLYLYSKDNIMTGTHKNIGKILCDVNWPQNVLLETRGNIISDELYYNDTLMKYKNDKAIRDFTCVEPSYYISIRYDGSVVLCCHVSEIYCEHKDYVLGNINEISLVDIINSDKAKEFKKILASEDFNSYPDCCKICHKDRKGFYPGFEKEKGKEQ